MKRILLATDLDDTLIGDDDAQRRLNDIIKCNSNIKLAYVTGRSLDKYSALQEERPLAKPGALVTALGTELYITGDRTEGWPIVNEWNSDEIRNRLSAFTELKPQPSSEQRDYKISYFLEARPDLIDKIKEALINFPVDISYSMDLYLDILPKDINKGAALKYLANLWEIEQKNIYACGDSLNDISMLSVSNAIVVGNAKPELKNWSRDKGDSVYEAMDNYADGIIEGLRHFGVLA